MYIIPQSLRNEIVECYKQKPIAIGVLQEKFGVCQPKISQFIKEAGVPIWPKNLIFNPDLKEDYFDYIDTEMKAYFLGLILTDGCVFVPKKGMPSISITLKSDDAYILQRFKEEIKADTKVIFDKRGTATIAVKSNRLADALSKYGVCSGKENRSHLPLIETNMMSHMLRGMFDGDGSVASDVARNGKHRHCFTICGQPSLMREIQEHLVKTCDIAARKQYNYSDNFGEVKWSKIEDMKKIGDYLYQDATFFMERKHQKFVNFCKHYNL